MPETPEPVLKPLSVSDNTPIGPAPGYLSPAEQWIWTEILRNSSPTQFTTADSLSLEVLCKMVYRMRNLDLQVSELTTLMDLLCKFGMTPAARLSLPPQDSVR